MELDIHQITALEATSPAPLLFQMGRAFHMSTQGKRIPFRWLDDWYGSVDRWKMTISAPP